MLSSSLGECMACLVRVPTENIKQKMQAGVTTSTTSTLQYILSNKGFTGFYTGYGTTLLREIPFAAIQFPLWEAMKTKLEAYQGSPTSPAQSAACGAFAGGFAAACTTPIDVIKTRLMLGFDANGVPYNGFLDVVRKVRKTEGTKTFFSGIGPRVTWITVGGFVFFGTYETAKKMFTE